MSSVLEKRIRKLCKEGRELDYGEVVDRVDFQELTPLIFYRDYVAANKPVVITGAIDHWPALSKWDDDYLEERLGDTEVTVALTPDGWADAVLESPERYPPVPLPPNRLPPPTGNPLQSPISNLSNRFDNMEMGSTPPTVDGAPNTHSSMGTEGGGLNAGGRLNGLGEAGTAARRQPPLRGLFMMPYERPMTFPDFLEIFYASRDPANTGGHRIVPYMQRQNGNLTEEFSALLGDIEADFSLFTEAFGAPPEALNLWFGDSRSNTSFHKDNYENCYAVLSGEKIFTLMPPSEVFRMQFGRYAVAKWEPISDDRPLEFAPRLAEPHEEISWSAVRTADPRAPGSNPSMDPSTCSLGPAPVSEDYADRKRRHPLFYDDRLPRPITVRVRRGEMLYLPSLWFHEVRQREVPDPLGDRVVAVNAWWDMRFDVKWAQYGFVKALTVEAGLADPDLQESEGELEGEE